MSRGRGGGGGGVKAALGQLWSTVPSMRLQLSFARPYGHQEQHPTPQRSYSGDVPATPTIARLLTVSMATREVRIRFVILLKLLCIHQLHAVISLSL